MKYFHNVVRHFIDYMIADILTWPHFDVRTSARVNHHPCLGGQHNVSLTILTRLGLHIQRVLKVSSSYCK